RPPAAGSFYPGDATELKAAVQRLLEAAPKVSSSPVRMVLAPHAGLVYSGAIAAQAFRQLTPGFERVVIVAANHSDQARFQGASPDRATHYQVPGLKVKVAPGTATLFARPGFVEAPAAHAAHMVEIELPFLWHANGGKPFEIVPLIVGRLNRSEAQALAAQLTRLAEPKTLFVFSVDLSHFHPYEEAVALDKPCLDAMARANADDLLSRCDSDGDQVLLTMLELGAGLGLTPRLLAYQNSGDVSQDRSRVVGYGAMVWEERFELGREEQEALLELARRAVETQIRQGRKIAVPPELASRFPRLRTQRGAFVTLRKEGKLRGCIGTLEAHRPLAEDVVENAVHAAIHDTRFSPVAAEELPLLHLDISVLDAPRPLQGLAGEALLEHLGERKPGLIIEYQGRRSTFLPSVWEELPEPARFLGHLCRKQGSPEACWKQPQVKLETYGTQSFEEP
ncbi:MAG: AmmeMemoRadiSam system protein A, partial [Deltaproteobacteria bacterium]|nr:AmmeMemoRadiSam system protein A [Deltaproteobacteria bacterium]